MFFSSAWAVGSHGYPSSPSGCTHWPLHPAPGSRGQWIGHCHITEKHPAQVLGQKTHSSTSSLAFSDINFALVQILSFYERKITFLFNQCASLERTQNKNFLKRYKIQLIQSLWWILDFMLIGTMHLLFTFVRVRSFVIEIIPRIFRYYANLNPCIQHLDIWN